MYVSKERERRDKMKKILCVTLALLCALLCFSSCGAQLYKQGEGELKIVATVFVPFDIAREVTGGKAELVLLQSNGADLHDYTPTTSALAELNSADILICIGGVTDDSWIDSAVAASENEALTVIKLTELCEGELTELEGHHHSDYCEKMHAHEHEEHSHEHEEHSHEHSADDGHGHVADEHVWTSPKNVISITERIASVCAEKDQANAEIYNANAERFKAALTELDARYRTAVNGSEKKTLVFADRFPFIYLTREYGICHYAAFSGCGSETDASFSTAARLLGAVTENGLNCVIVTENTDGKLAESISDSLGCEILVLNSLQSVTAEQIDGGITYLSAMEQNLAVLTQALG